MWRRRLLVGALLLAGVPLLSDIAWRERRQQKLRDEHAHVSRVDHGVVLHVVVADPYGTEYVKGKPKLRILRSHRRGGMLAIDHDGARWIGPSVAPMQWYCSADAEPLILHDDSLPDSLLVYGSEGAGKTDAQSKWCYFRALHRISEGYTGEIGMTAPTAERADFIKKAIERNWSPAWARWNERHQSFTLHTGLSIKLRSTKRQSAASGSPLQGYNWSDAGSDEIQDSTDADDDTESRLRDAPGGRAKRFATATAKDHPDFRTWRDRALSAEVNGRPAWHKAVMLASSSPFIATEFLARKRSTMSLREYQRRYETVDLGPERQVYHSWARTAAGPDGKLRPGNLRPIPEVGATGVTARELARFGHGLALLAGHDPGKRQDVTLFLRAYEFANARFPDGRFDLRPRWFVVEEITTDGDTHETHVARVLATAQSDRYRCNTVDMRGRADPEAGKLLVRIDPHTQSGDEHPGRDLYTIWRNHGIATFAAAYAPGTTRPLPIKPETRIELINTLLCDAHGIRRLFVACDARGTPCAPRLVDALETMERDAINRAEWERKDGRDKSHWPAALAYALHAIERPRMSVAA